MRVSPSYEVEQLGAGNSGHADVAEDDVEVLVRLEELDRLHRVFRSGCRVLFEGEFHVAAYFLIVVYD